MIKNSTNIMHKIILNFFLLLFFFYKRNINIMYYFSNNFGDNLNYFLLKDMIEGNINFYDRTFKNQNDKSRDLNNINNLNIIAKIDLIFIGSNLDVICNLSYAFDNKSCKHKSIISKLYFKIFDYFYPLIIYGTGFILQIIFKMSLMLEI